MNILLIEPSASGHRFQYLVWATRAFLQIHKTVCIGTCDEHVRLPLLLELQDEFADRIDVVSVPSNDKESKFLFRELRNWTLFRRIYKKAAKEHSIEFVFVPYLDHFFYAMAFINPPFSRIPFSGIIMAPTFHQRDCGILRPKQNKDVFEKLLFHRCFRSRNLKTVFTIDPLLCQSNYANNSLCYLPDPSSDFALLSQAEAQKKLSLNIQGKIVLVFGAITSRKGVDSLLKAASGCDLDIHVLLAGRHDSEIQELLTTETAKILFKKNKLTSINEYIPAELETPYYCATDIIWLGYKEHYAMSGVLVKAAACKRNVLACEEGLIGYLTESYQLGITTNTQYTGRIVSSLDRLLKNPTPINESKRREFVEQHELEKFTSILINHYK